MKIKYATRSSTLSTSGFFRRFIVIWIFCEISSPVPVKRRAIPVSGARRRNLIEATKTFRGYKSLRNDKIGATRRAERHAACRTRTHARGILMGFSSLATLHTEALDCHSCAVYFVCSKRRLYTSTNMYIGIPHTLDHYLLTNTWKINTYLY